MSAAPAIPALDRVVALLERLVPVASAIRRGVAGVILIEAMSAAFIAFALGDHGVSNGWRTVVAVVLAVPPLVLAAFWVLMREVVKLPARVADLPKDAYGHGFELERLIETSRNTKPGRPLTMPLKIWRFARLLQSTRELLTPWAPLLPLLSVPFLGAVAFAALVLALELPIVIALVLAGP